MYKENDTVTVKFSGEKGFFVGMVDKCPIKGGPSIKTNIAIVHLIEADEEVQVLLKDLEPYNLYQ